MITNGSSRITRDIAAVPLIPSGDDGAAEGEIGSTAAEGALEKSPADL